MDYNEILKYYRDSIFRIYKKEVKFDKDNYLDIIGTYFSIPLVKSQMEILKSSNKEVLTNLESFYNKKMQFSYFNSDYIEKRGMYQKLPKKNRHLLT